MEVNKLRGIDGRVSSISGLNVANKVIKSSAQIHTTHTKETKYLI